MGLSGLLDSVTQRKVEADPGFRAEIAQYARRGLTVIGWIEIGMTTVGALIQLLGIGFLQYGGIVWWRIAFLISIGCVSLLSARWASDRYVRSVGIGIGAVSVVALLAADIVITHGAIEDKLVVNVLTVMLVGVACLPLTLLQSALFNGFAVVAFAAAWELAGQAGMQVPADKGILMLTLLGGLCVFLSTVNYARLLAAYRGHQEALRASKELRESEVRACTAESAITNVRLAAALSHELNTPLGALKSAVQTMTSAALRVPGAPPEPQERLARAVEDAGEVAIHAAGRLESIVQRMQRFSNLDGADQQSIDLPVMLRDIIALHEGTGDSRIRVETEFVPVPPFPGQPQLLSAIFSTLLRKALDAAGKDGRVHMRTRHLDRWIVLEIEHGHMNVPVDFQLGFAVEHSRISAANWDLFSARQVIRAHGGDIEATGGTAIRVRLPAETATAAAVT